MVESGGSILLDGGLSWEEARQLARGVPRRLPVARNQTRLPLGPALLVRLLPHPPPSPVPRDPSAPP
ncbi:MAG: hypothetical protein M3O70_13965, partial [Actinomycetota bacterium]|nr:hypothetical protein [Actinomycetota bacterium]